MKIRIDKDIVEFIPEHAAEKAELEALWVKMGNCLGDTKQLQPIGTYLPSEDRVAVLWRWDDQALCHRTGQLGMNLSHFVQ